MVSCAVCGLYGAATSRWDMSIEVEHAGTFEAFWDTFAFVVNNVIFFFSGMACVNFAVRCVPSMSAPKAATVPCATLHVASPLELVYAGGTKG